MWNVRDDVFIATKVRTPESPEEAIASLEACLNASGVESVCVWDLEMMWASDTLRVEVDGGSPVPFRRTEPPILDSSTEPRLEYLGAFSLLVPRGAHSRVSQLWLWKSDDAVLAVGIFEVLVAGRRADYVAPSVLGIGRLEEGGWRFQWRARGRRWEMLLRLGPEAVEIVFPTGQDAWPDQRLLAGALFHSPGGSSAECLGSAMWNSSGDYARQSPRFSP